MDLDKWDYVRPSTRDYSRAFTRTGRDGMSLWLGEHRFPHTAGYSWLCCLFTRGSRI